MTVAHEKCDTKYETYAKPIVQNLIKNGNGGSTPSGVAETIYKAATDGRKKMRYPTGKMKNMILLRRFLPLGLYQWMVSRTLEG